VLQSTRLIGAEIECISEKLSYDCDNGENEARLPEYVSLTSDGSLNEHGVEIRTAPMAGARAEKMLKDLCNTLREAEADIDTSCGLHIHLNAPDYHIKHGEDTPETERKLHRLKNIMIAYIVYDDVFLSFLPRSRRRNRYCRQLREAIKLSEIREANTPNALETLWYRVNPLEQYTDDELRRIKGNHYNETRYRGINFHSLFADGHLEIRYHSGTIDAEKILQWANIHAQMLDMFARPIDTDRLYDALTILSLPEKTQSLYDLLNLSKDAQNYFNSRQTLFINANE
jgi:hypothetical protein